MPTLTFTTKYKKNQKLMISPEEVLAFYLYGVDILSKDGSKFDEETTLMYIKAAQDEVEKFFDIRLFWQLITETRDYFRDDYLNNFPIIRTSLPVRNAHTLIGLINGNQQIRYPEEWLSNRTSSDGTVYRQFSIVPNGSAATADADIILAGVYTRRGIMGFNVVSNYWTCQYETGYKYNEMPNDLFNIIGMMAAIRLLDTAGDLILGAGIASQSLSIDGLNQSISSTSSPTNSGYGARILSYQKSIKESVNRLHTFYKGITFGVL